MMNVYTKTGCPWCMEATKYLKQRGIAFNEINVSSDSKAMAEMVDLSGQTKAPTLSYDDHILADFGVDELIPFLEKHDIQ